MINLKLTPSLLAGLLLLSMTSLADAQFLYVYPQSTTLVPSNQVVQTFTIRSGNRVSTQSLLLAPAPTFSLTNSASTQTATTQGLSDVINEVTSVLDLIDRIRNNKNPGTTQQPTPGTATAEQRLTTIEDYLKSKDVAFKPAASTSAPVGAGLGGTGSGGIGSPNFQSLQSSTNSTTSLESKLTELTTSNKDLKTSIDQLAKAIQSKSNLGNNAGSNNKKDD
jgi:hypothetical protein